MECYLHPGYGAGAMCVACSRPICAVCREDVAGHPMCPECVAAHQARLGEEPAPAAASAYEPAPVLTCGPGHYFKALLFGLVTAVVGAIIWDKFVFYTHFQVGLIAVFLGAAVGIAVKMGAEGRRGKMLPFMGALLAGFSILLGYALLAQDQAMQDPQFAAKLNQIPVFIRIPILIIAVIPGLDVMDWIFVAIGLWEGWSIPRRSEAEPMAPDTTATSVPTPTSAAPAGPSTPVSMEAPPGPSSVPTPTFTQPAAQEPQPTSDKPW
jgi:hypothetical protein